MSKKFKPYQQLFEQKKSVKEVKGSLRESLMKLSKIKRSLKKMREEDEVDVNAVDDAIEQIEDVVTDIIDDLGATSPAVDTLIDAARDLEMQSDEEEFDFDEFDEAEEDDEDDDEELEEAEEDDEDDEDKKEESVKKKRKK